MNWRERKQKEDEALKRLEPYKKLFHNFLLSLGYNDIFIELKPSLYSKEYFNKIKEIDTYVYNNINFNIEEDDFYYLSSIRIYFWDENVGYHLWLNCRSSSKFESPAPIPSDDMNDILSHWVVVLKFLSNREKLKCADEEEIITKQLVKHLNNNDFEIEKIFYNKDILANKNNKTHIIDLHKIVTQGEFGWEDEDGPIEYHEEDIKPFENRFVSLLEENGISKYKIDLDKGLQSLSVQVFYNGVNHQIKILSYNAATLYCFPEVDEIFQEVLSFYLCDVLENRKNFLTKIKNNFYHIYSTNKDCSEMFVYKYGNEIEIIRQSEVLFDEMDGHQFEYFCADVLKQNGFKNVSVTSGSGDQGIDIIAYKDDIKYGIQCKCYNSDIGNKAVQEVYAGKTFYNCHVGIVLTNRDFTRSAIDLAEKDGIILWNRTKLLQMIDNCKDVVIANKENSIFNI